MLGLGILFQFLIFYLGIQLFVVIMSWIKGGFSQLKYPAEGVKKKKRKEETEEEEESKADSSIEEYRKIVKEE